MSAPLSDRVWDIYLPGWVIEDGNYPDFEAGQTAEFALNFWMHGGAIVRPAREEKGVLSSEGFLYDVVAELTMQTADITVIDLGVVAYCESSPLQASFQPGSRVAVQLGIRVDPYFYFERLSKLAGIPPPDLFVEDPLNPTDGWTLYRRDGDFGPSQRAECSHTRSPQRGLRRGSEDGFAGGDEDSAEYVRQGKLLPVALKRRSSTANNLD